MLVFLQEVFTEVSSKCFQLTSEESYRGHVFWDELFLAQCYRQFPKAIKPMLLYRYYRLDAARDIAKKAILEIGFVTLLSMAWEVLVSHGNQRDQEMKAHSKFT
jgi:hypothetical protein